MSSRQFLCFAVRKVFDGQSLFYLSLPVSACLYLFLLCLDEYAVWNLRPAGPGARIQQDFIHSLTGVQRNMMDFRLLVRMTRVWHVQFRCQDHHGVIEEHTSTRTVPPLTPPTPARLAVPATPLLCSFPGALT